MMTWSVTDGARFEIDALTALGSIVTRTLGSGAVTLWLAGNSVFTAFCAVSLAGVIIGAATGAPTGLMLKSVLMAAS